MKKGTWWLKITVTESGRNHQSCVFCVGVRFLFTNTWSLTCPISVSLHAAQLHGLLFPATKPNIPGTVPDELINEECPHFPSSLWQHFWSCCTNKHQWFNRTVRTKVNTLACCSFWASGSAPTATTSLALFLHTSCDVRKKLHLTDLLSGMKYRDICYYNHEHH